MLQNDLPTEEKVEVYWGGNHPPVVLVRCPICKAHTELHAYTNVFGQRLIKFMEYHQQCENKGSDERGE